MAIGIGHFTVTLLQIVYGKPLQMLTLNQARHKLYLPNTKGLAKNVHRLTHPQWKSQYQSVFLNVF